MILCELFSQFVFVKLVCFTVLVQNNNNNEREMKKKSFFFFIKNHMHTKGSTPHQHLFILQPIYVDYVSPYRKTYDIIVFHIPRLFFHSFILSFFLSFVPANWARLAGWLAWTGFDFVVDCYLVCEWVYFFRCVFFVFAFTVCVCMCCFECVFYCSLLLNGSSSFV